MTTDAAITHAARFPAGRAPSPDRQTYLIGDTLSLRGLELADARWTTAWRPSPFPISAHLSEEQLKQQAGEDEHRTARLVACRREDGRPIGSALIDNTDATTTVLALHADPALGADGAHVQAEMLGLLLPWLSGERPRPVVRLTTDVDLTPVVAAAEALGMRPAVRLRDGVWRDGQFRDRIFYEYLQPALVAKLGDPGPGIVEAGEPVISPRSPAPRRDPRQALPLPPNALIGSQRLALRPMQMEDAETIANLIRAEPAADFGHGRFPYSALSLADWIGKIGKNDPAKDLEFAVVLRESGELIGETGLYDVDWLARSAESGSWLYRAEDRNAGYGTEAKQLLLEYAFEWLGLHMIWSWVKSRNPRSQAALRKQGYRDAGRVTWVNFGPDGFENAHMFDLLASEWRAARDGSA